jgi:hypothetical protein
MTYVKQQLKAYYRAQGLRGKQLKRAVWADNVKAVAHCTLDRPIPNERLSYLFLFSGTPEGHKYWRMRADA